MIFWFSSHSTSFPLLEMFREHLHWKPPEKAYLVTSQGTKLTVCSRRWDCLHTHEKKIGKADT